MAASVGRMDEVHLSETHLSRWSPTRRTRSSSNSSIISAGKFPHCGLDLFSKLATLFRPDLYFPLPKRWGIESGCLKFIDNDPAEILRRLPAHFGRFATRSASRRMYAARSSDGRWRWSPIHPTLENAINRSIGSALAWANVLEPGEGFLPGLANDDGISMPLEVASAALRVRRGEMRLRNQLIRDYRKRVRHLRKVRERPSGSGVHRARTRPEMFTSPRNAVLLRTDLHTMWDLNLVAVEPETMEVSYLRQDARNVLRVVRRRPNSPRRATARRSDAIAVKERWQHFIQHEKAIARIRSRADVRARSRNRVRGRTNPPRRRSRRSRRLNRATRLPASGAATVKGGAQPAPHERVRRNRIRDRGLRNGWHGQRPKGVVRAGIRCDWRERPRHGRLRPAARDSAVRATRAL